MVGMGSSSMSWSFSEREWPPLTMRGDLIPPRLSHLLNNRFGLFVHCSIKKFTHLRHAPIMKDVWCRGPYRSKGIDILQLSSNAFVSPYASFLGFFNRGETRKDLANEQTSNFGTSGRGRDSISGGQWTDVLLTANVLIYIAQIASRGKLFMWGAKINTLIEKGQVWRLVTSSFLHVNLWHLMINCYSLNNVGPSVERISGPRRFLAVYFTSAIADRNSNELLVQQNAFSWCIWSNLWDGWITCCLSHEA
ncbi:RHOMBOID-like protein 10, chloroplastic isoform X2 [Tripterygium wilfordii]|uniref:RHOMBOID-like protein 10, chloroplastic isoform X2 n=1 Tax=Tripterygium wilfordii TaxID=458696 RepID=UPI0018F8208F|nr:RHOMBOID-like protein 10, chloroplastic isoform X2 [Tripterygium wilfordii]